MRLGTVFAAGLVLAASSCVPAMPPEATTHSLKAPAAAAAPCPACPTEGEIAAEAYRLRRALRAAVFQGRLLARDRDRLWIELAKKALALRSIAIGRPQLLVVVNRNPAVQRLAVVLADPRGPWRVIGGSKVSTGEAHRYGYFITPTGVFRHTGEIRDYRALGTKNAHGIRGLGVKGMRVWDFGWQRARRGWEPGSGEIRLLMHATDPIYLAPFLGRPASKGCIRIPAAMNRFLDHYGVLDREYDELARYDEGYREVLSPDAQPTFLAGDKLIVVDSRLRLAPPLARRRCRRRAAIARRSAALRSAPTIRFPRRGDRAPVR